MCAQGFDGEEVVVRLACDDLDVVRQGGEHCRTGKSGLPQPAEQY